MGDWKKLQFCYKYLCGATLMSSSSTEVVLNEWYECSRIQMKNSFNLLLGFNLIKGLLNLKNNSIKSSTSYKGLCQGLS